MIQINNLENCCGCSVCQSVCPKQAISMKPDELGFLYPQIDLNKCVNCGLCEKKCPIKKRSECVDLDKPKLFLAARLKNREDLLLSSSGGAFWAFAQYVISQKGIVVGAEYSEDMSVRHTFAKTLEECEKYRGSKYSQSNIIGVFDKVKTYLLSGQLVLFTGNPCQCEGLKLYLGKSYDNLITVDLVCHAVPSPKFFKEYCEYVSKVFGKTLKSINMRDKADHGWDHHFSYRYCFKDGSSEIDSPKVSNWGRIFFSQLVNRPSCHSCRFANLNRAGDISIADFWDDDHKRDDVFDAYGTSLVLLNSENGERFFSRAQSLLNTYEISEKESLQPCLLRPTPRNLRREDFLFFYNKYGFEKTYKKFFTDSLVTVLKKKIGRYKKKIKAVL